MALNVWNTLDEAGLYLGMERFSYETDENLFNRIKLFSKWKYKTDYFTQMHSIPLQIGAKYFNVVEIFSTIEDNEFKCNCDWEYFTLEDSVEYLRVFINTEGCMLSKILEGIDKLTNFDYRLIKSQYVSFPTKYLIRKKNYAIAKDIISSKDTILNNKNIMYESLDSRSKHISDRQSSISEVQKAGDYFVDEKAGFLHIYDAEPEPFSVTYKYYNPKFIIEGSDMALVPLNIIAKYGITDKLIHLLPSILDGQVWGR
jgi:hypothetical protein